MEIRARSLWSVSLFTLLILAIATPSVAHPPWNPYDDSRFAPITSFGPKVGIQLITRAVNDPNTGVPVGERLVSPLKAVAAPGVPNYIFIVDQPGALWAVNLNDPSPNKQRRLFLDLRPGGPRPYVVPLGVCGPDTFDERGLLGVAFHPNYNGTGFGKGRFYTFTSEAAPTGTPPTPPPTIPDAVPFDPDHQNVIREWINANPADPLNPSIAEGRILIRVNWPQFNHDGGDLAFGHDRKLYISMGDGGGADDADGQPFVVALPKYVLQTPNCTLAAPITGHQGETDGGNGRRLNTPLGKILRIDVDTMPPVGSGKTYVVPADNPFVRMRGAVPEIWAYGFRNPYRFSFDKKTGDLYVGDVGQNDIEEVDVVVRGGHYGWNCKEGTLFFHINGIEPDDGKAERTVEPERATQCSPRNNRFIDPIAQYDTHHEGHSVVGGFVYRGNRMPGLKGKYLFGEFSLLFKFPRGPHDYARLFTFDPGGGHGLRQISEMLVLPGGAISMALLGVGQDAAGEIYYMGNISGLPHGNTGVVVRLVPAPEGDRDDGHGHGHGHGGDHDD